MHGAANERRTIVVKEIPTEIAASPGGKQPKVSDAAAGALLSNDERLRLTRDMTERGERLATLERELELLQRQQVTLMRRKQREHDGHKDPLLLENTKLQQEIERQINALRKFAEISATKLRLDTEARKPPPSPTSSADKKRKPSQVIGIRLH